MRKGLTMKLFKVLKASVIFALLWTTQIISQEAKVLPQGPDENDECSFEELGSMFESYYQYYPELYYAAHWYPKDDWTVLRGKYKCNEVRDSLFEKEKQRFKKNFEVKTPIEGIKAGYLFVNGVYIRPPYKIEPDLDNLRLLVNNVQIWPIQRPSKLEESQYDKYFDDTYNIALQVQDLILQYLERTKYMLTIRVNWLLSHSSKDKALEYLKGVLESMKNSGSIYDYKIHDEEKLQFDIYWCDFWGKEYPFNIYEPKKKIEIPSKSPEEIKIIVERMAQNEKRNKTDFITYLSKEISDFLNSNKLIIISATYRDELPRKEYSKENMKKICENIREEKSNYKKMLQFMKIDKKLNNALGIEFLFNLTPKDCIEITQRIDKENAEKEK